MQQMDSEDACELLSDDVYFRKDKCDFVENGIMKKGLSNAL